MCSWWFHTNGVWGLSIEGCPWCTCSQIHAHLIGFLEQVPLRPGKMLHRQNSRIMEINSVSKGMNYLSTGEEAMKLGEKAMKDLY